MKRVLSAVALIACSAPAVAAEDAEGLIKKHGCIACHAVEKPLVGPAYSAVAKKYAGQKGADKALFDKVRKGGAGVWGQVPMPPNPQVPDADIRAMVAWVLTRK